MNAILDVSKAQVYFDGIFSEPRLQHPEGVALDSEDNVFCGTENGEIMRIKKDKSGIEMLATSKGFILGIAVHDNRDIAAVLMETIQGEGGIVSCDKEYLKTVRDIMFKSLFVIIC